MTFEQVLFGFFAVIAVVSSILMITRKNPVISALFLILNFGALSGIYVMLQAQFIAVVQVIVYAGAIMVLFLFLIMLLRPENEKEFFKEKTGLKVFALALGAFMFLQLVYAIFFAGSFSPQTDYIKKSYEIGKIENIGLKLYTEYLLPFESIAFLLLAATIGALVLSKKKFD